MDKLSFTKMIDDYCQAHPDEDRYMVIANMMKLIIGATGTVKDNGDGTFTHTYTFPNPRAAHASDEREAKPL